MSKNRNLWLLLNLLFSSAIPLLTGCGIEGLNNANPATDFRVNTRTGEVRYRNNKDVDFALPKAEYTDATGRKIVIEGLDLRSNASDVRVANYQQMLGMAYQAQVNWAGASQMVSSLTGLVAEIMPFVPSSIAASSLGKLKAGTSVGLPGGGGFSTGGFSEAQIDGLLKIAGTQAGKREPATQPTQ